MTRFKYALVAYGAEIVAVCWLPALLLVVGVLLVLDPPPKRGF